MHRVDAGLARPADLPGQAAVELAAEIDHPLLVEGEEIVAEVDAARAVVARSSAISSTMSADGPVADLAAEDVVRAAVDAAVGAAARGEDRRDARHRVAADDAGRREVGREVDEVARRARQIREIGHERARAVVDQLPVAAEVNTCLRRRACRAHRRRRGE